MNNFYGLGMSETAASVKVFKDFFIKLTLPYEVKRNEVVTLNILLISYLSFSQDVTVSVARNDAEFTVLDDEWRREKFSSP